MPVPTWFESATRRLSWSQAGLSYRAVATGGASLWCRISGLALVSRSVGEERGEYTAPEFEE